MTAEHDSPWSMEQIKEYFKKYSSSYDEDITIDSYPAPFIIAEWIKQTPSIAAQALVKVMDLGCGTGASSSKLFFANGKKYHVHGIDATKEMLDKAKKLPFKSLYCQNLEESLQVDSETFDAVVCVGVFDFIIEKKRVLNEISRLLKIGGVAGITVPDSASNKGEIEECLCRANLELIKSERFFGYRDSTTGEVVNFWGIFLKKI